MPATRWAAPIAVIAVVFSACLGDLVTPPETPSLARAAAGVTVTATTPAESPRDTTLDVLVLGSGFDNGSQATFPLHGVLDPRVRVNGTRFVSSSQVVANLTIAADAPADHYDAVVVTAAGKKGIGSELFTITLRAEPLAGSTKSSGVSTLGVATGSLVGLAACPTVPNAALWALDGSIQVLPLGPACGGGTLGSSSGGTILGGAGGIPGRVIWRPMGAGYQLVALGSAADGTFPYTGGGVNDAGEVIGWAAGGRLFWWSEATGWLSLAVPAGATNCQALEAISNLGAIAAKCVVGGVTIGYYWSSHSAAPVLLPRPAGAGDPAPKDINDAGVIVGNMFGGTTRAVRWTPVGGGYTATILPDLGYGAAANAIAADGTIAGTIQTNKAGTHPRPAIWLPSGGFQLLGLLESGGGGEALGIATLPGGGLVVVGYDGSQAVRWRAGSLP